MDNRYYHIKISPENIKNDLFIVPFDAGSSEPIDTNDPCCTITTTIPIEKYTGFTYVYSSMTQILTSGPNGNSLLTGLTIPIMLTENTIDIGYYSVFDGLALQQDTMLNFVFTADSTNNKTIKLYNTSDTEFKKYLAFSNYQVDWGDNSNIVTITNNTNTPYSHPYTSPGTYTITMSGMSPWGYNVVKKQVSIPFTGTTISDPFGIATFTFFGGSWSATPISYKYIFTGDSYCDLNSQPNTKFTSVPFKVTGYTKSSINDLSQYASNSQNFFNGKFNLNVQVTGASGCVGTVYSPGPNFTSYTINDILYTDYSEGYTIFEVNSSGLTSSMLVCSAITKDEVLLNIIDQPEIQSNVYVERGKNSGIESLDRLGEVDNIGDLVKYGYKFFNVIKT